MDGMEVSMEVSTDINGGDLAAAGALGALVQLTVRVISQRWALSSSAKLWAVWVLLTAIYAVQGALDGQPLRIEILIYKAAAAAGVATSLHGAQKIASENEPVKPNPAPAPAPNPAPAPGEGPNYHGDIFPDDDDGADDGADDDGPEAEDTYNRYII